MVRIEQSKVLPRAFYDRDPETVARELLGKVLVRRLPEGIVAGIIVETEAYLAFNDPANHAFVGRNEKNKSMFGPPGCAYVYRIHQVYCLNAVTEPEGVPSAVLIRSLMPLTLGDPLPGKADTNDRPMTGPGRLCRSLRIDRRLDGWDLTLGQELWIAELSDLPFVVSRQIHTGPRIGVTAAQDLPLRFWLADPPMLSYVSKVRRPLKGLSFLEWAGQ
ncbi:MAG: DNA-3-methyladenine glycosylase [Armatimonadetes bacterium]|nr:DNA-3-methyladenine glycosylase [Armatimonadota bacterium]